MIKPGKYSSMEGEEIHMLLPLSMLVWMRLMFDCLVRVSRSFWTRDVIISELWGFEAHVFYQLVFSLSLPWNYMQAFNKMLSYIRCLRHSVSSQQGKGNQDTGEIETVDGFWEWENQFSLRVCSLVGTPHSSGMSQIQCVGSINWTWWVLKEKERHEIEGREFGRSYG